MSGLAWLALPDTVRPVAEALYDHQPATAAELADHTGLALATVEAGLAHLGEQGILRGGIPLRDGRPGFHWLDPLPALRRLRGEPEVLA